jgi:hypothetical protein
LALHAGRARSSRRTAHPSRRLTQVQTATSKVMCVRMHVQKLQAALFLARRLAAEQARIACWGLEAQVVVGDAWRCLDALECSLQSSALAPSIATHKTHARNTRSSCAAQRCCWCTCPEHRQPQDPRPTQPITLFAGLDHAAHACMQPAAALGPSWRPNIAPFSLSQCTKHLCCGALPATGPSPGPLHQPPPVGQPAFQWPVLPYRHQPNLLFCTRQQHAHSVVRNVKLLTIRTATPLVA